MRPASLLLATAHPSSDIACHELRLTPRARGHYDASSAPVAMFALGRDGAPSVRCRVLRAENPRDRLGEQRCLVLVDGEREPRWVAAERRVE